MYQCPICKTEIAIDRLMCAAHWRLVSRETRDWVWATWKRRCALVTSTDPRPVEQAKKEHELATNAAITEVETTLEAKPKKAKKSQGKLPL